LEVNVASTGNTIYFALKDDASAISSIRAEFAALALSIATDPAAAATVTSATINNQTFSSTPLMSNGQRFDLLRYVIACVDNGGTISSTQLTRF